MRKGMAKDKMELLVVPHSNLLFISKDKEHQVYSAPIPFLWSPYISDHLSCFPIKPFPGESDTFHNLKFTNDPQILEPLFNQFEWASKVFYNQISDDLIRKTK